MRGNFSTTCCLVAFTFLLVMDNIGFAERIIYVDADANGLNDGTNWENAYNFLQDALADANYAEKPVEIRVAQGIYRPDRSSTEPNGTGDREATFQLINGVALKGGYAGFGEPDPNARDIEAYKTILSGDLAVNDIPTQPYYRDKNTQENSYHVVTGSGTDANAILDGLTITAGNADYSIPISGGGMDNDSGSPTVANCIFSKNVAAYGGGCVYNYYSNPSFTNCVFSGGIASYSGGGMYNEHSSPTLTNCTFSENVIVPTLMAKGGGGMYNYYSSPTLTDCTFSKNWTSGTYGSGMLNWYSSVILMHCNFTENLGRGIYNRNSSNANLTDCTFNRNSGGGICNENGTLTLSNCIFSENSATAGGGIYNMYMYNMSNNITLINCSFSGNLAYVSGNEYGYGGGIYTSGNATIINCTFNQNLAERSGGGMYTIGEPTVTNCIFSGNSAGKEGGGMCIGMYTSPTILTNCTFAGNLARNGKALACFHGVLVGGGNIRGINCILWDGGDEIFWAPLPSKADITYSDIQGGWPGEGNIDKDPCFAGPGYWDPNGTPQDVNDDFWVDGDYHLKSQAGRWDANSASWAKDDVTSPCIDAGDPASPIGLEPFPNGGIINMGAYGGTIEASKSYFGEPVCETIVAGDINGDCIVNLKDFALMALHWMEEK
jgi:hypothetical protein